MKWPGLSGVVGRNLRVTEHATSAAHKLRPAIARDIDDSRRLVVGDGKGYVALPVSRLVLWVAEPPRFLARKAQYDQVGPAVVVHIVVEPEKVFRIAGDVERLG